ncbi:MAG: plastocyanin/azurin family copper-binding protein [Bdellovibrionia bacterium]
MARNRVTYRLLAAIATAGGLAFVSSFSSSHFDMAQAQPSDSVTVTISPGATGKGPQAYGQNPLEINAGATVTWVNNDTVSHTVTSDTPGQFDSGNLLPGQTYQHTFNATGSYPYHCAIHGQQSMSGAVHVNAAAAGGAGGVAAGGVAGGAAGGGGGPGPVTSPTASPTASPGSGPGPLAGYTCDDQGLCCNATGGCVPSNHFTCDKTGFCCQDDGSNCSFNHQCTGDYCCSAEGHCGKITYGSGAAHCVPRTILSGDICCDEHGSCDSGYTNCNGLTCCNGSGKCILQDGPYKDPRPGATSSPSPSPSPSPTPTQSSSPNANPSAGATQGPSGGSGGTSSSGNSGGTPSGSATGGVPSGG